MNGRTLRGTCAASVLLAALVWNVQKEQVFRQSRKSYAEIDDAIVEWDPAEGQPLPPNGSVVHFSSQNLTSAPIQDADLGVAAMHGVRLDRHSEICQWVEKSKRQCMRKSLVKYLLEIFFVILVDLIITMLIGRSTTTTSTFGVNLDDCWTEYPVEKAWVSTGWVDHAKFHKQELHIVNPEPHILPPAKQVEVAEAMVGGIRLGGNLLKTLGKTAAAVLVFGPEDCAAAMKNVAEAATPGTSWVCGRLMPHLQEVEGFDYHGGGWFVREHIHNASKLLEPSMDNCEPGDVRVAYTLQVPTELTVVGRVDENRTVSVFPLHSRTAPAGFLEEGVWTLRELFERTLGKEHSCCRHSRLCLLLCLCYAFLELRHWGPRSLSGKIRSCAHLAVLLLVPICLFAVHLGLVWTALYGLADWRGQETSWPQVGLVSIAVGMLAAIARKHEALTAVLEQGSIAAKRLVLLRVNASFFRVLAQKDESSCSQRRARIARFGLGAAVAAAVALVWLGLVDGAADLTGRSANRLEPTLIAVAAVAVVAAVAAATAAEAPPPDASALAECGAAQHFTTFDCPICLETTQDGLVLSPCGHALCAPCWPHLRDASGRCPQCRRIVDAAIAIDRQADVGMAHFEGVTRL